jgi:membrane-associated phospholipid phosphatase
MLAAIDPEKKRCTVPNATHHGEDAGQTASNGESGAAGLAGFTGCGGLVVRRWPLWVVALLTAAAAALRVDLPLARWCVDDICFSPIRNLFHCAEPFGHAVGVLLIVVVIDQLDRPRRRVLPLLLATAWGAGLAADVLKMLVTRVRPYRLESQGFDFQGDVWSTFGEWLPIFGGGSAGQSFPSAHVATATAFAIVLGAVYPVGQRIFLVLAVLVACQRIESGFHYLSDTLVGAAVGLVVGVIARQCGGRLWGGRAKPIVG